ncbi:hypothetical protein [Achromobacter xylosoxidans]|uniref:hypothetical protein n=1 Tax=Alcaligenes xylosoxydans xylosoxydans TaxID=85698 RepID=UPI00292EB7AA|nr:hypothetical protein [Achromobacter xylosoxidans]WOB71292.1 hypothetical protein PZA07_18565 [Achromobacter xylosoxidans]
MKFKAALLISAITAVVAAPANAEPPRSVDARSFDIAGVKTGMDYDEAVAAAEKNFGVGKNQIKAGYPTLNPVTNTKQPQNFSYEKDGVRLVVHFEPRVPVDKQRPLAVSQVRYEMPWTPANKDAMAQAVVQKYGKQSNFPNQLNLEWCQKPSTNPGMGCSTDMTQAVLKYSGVSVQLYDPAWTHARIEFINQSNSRKPSF